MRTWFPPSLGCAPSVSLTPFHLVILTDSDSPLKVPTLDLTSFWCWLGKPCYYPVFSLEVMLYLALGVSCLFLSQSQWLGTCSVLTGLGLDTSTLEVDVELHPDNVVWANGEYMLSEDWGLFLEMEKWPSGRTDPSNQSWTVGRWEEAYWCP